MSKKDIAKQVAIAAASVKRTRVKSDVRKKRTLGQVIHELTDVIEEEGGTFISARMLEDGRVEVTYSKTEVFDFFG